MRSSLKKFFAGVLVVAMVVTAHGFNSLAVTLDNIVTRESTINQERNKDNQTKYFDELLSEKNQLLMKGDESDGSVLTTMPDKDTDATKKEVVITTMLSDDDDKTSSDDFSDDKTEAEEKENDDAKIEIDIDNDDIEDDKNFVVDDTPLTNDKENIQQEVEDDVEVKIDVDTATDSEVVDTNDGVFGDSDLTFLGGFIILPRDNYKNEYTNALASYYIMYKDAVNNENRVYTIPITKALRNYLIHKIKGRIDTDVIHFDTNIIEYDDFIVDHSDSEFIRFVTGDPAKNEDTGALEPKGSLYIAKTYEESPLEEKKYDKNGELIEYLGGASGAVSTALTGIYLTRNSDRSVTIHFVQRTLKFLDSFIQWKEYGNTYTIPPYKVRIVFDENETSKVNWDERGGQWIDTSKKFETFSELKGVPASSLPKGGAIKKDKYTLAGWKMYHSYEDSRDDINGTMLDNGIPAQTWGDIWLVAMWERSSVDIGDEVVFGKYFKYDGVNSKYPMEWIVRDVNVKERKVRLTSLYIIDAQPSLGSGMDPYSLETVEQTYVHKWLNGSEFYNNNEVFTQEERKQIIGSINLPERADGLEMNRRGLFTDFASKRVSTYKTHSGIWWWSNDISGNKAASYKHLHVEPVEGIDYDRDSCWSDVQNLYRLRFGVRPTMWVSMDYNFETISDVNSRRTKSIKIPKELIYRKDGFNTAAKAHVIRPQEAEDFYEVLGLNKDEINSINLGWDSNHRPKEAYEIIDYYSDLRVAGDWRGELGVAQGKTADSLDPVEANTVNAALLYDETSKKYDVYLFGMYALWSLDGKRYGIYWDLSDIADEIKKDTGINIKKHESKVNWVIREGAVWINEKAKFETYEEGTAHALPTANDLKMLGSTLVGWMINNDFTEHTTIPETQTGEITLTAMWEKRKVDLPLSMMITKDNDGNIYIKPDKTKWKSQLGLEYIENIESITIEADHTDKKWIAYVDYVSTELRGLALQQKAAEAIRNGRGLSDDSSMTAFLNGSDDAVDFLKDTVFDSTFDLISSGDMCAILYKDNEGKYYVNFKDIAVLHCNQEGHNVKSLVLNETGEVITNKTLTTVYWDFSDIDINSPDPIINPADDYQEGYGINWVLGDGKFKDEYKSYETALHKTTEDFILPSKDTLDAPYRKVLKEWTIDGIATTSISKDIRGEVTVTAVWTRSIDNFESYSIGKYKSSSLDSEEEEELEWIILDKVDGKLLLTTKNVIDNKSYNTNGSAKFDNSSISNWLNNDFYSNVFNDDQKANILKEGKEKVFLLTVKDAQEFFVNNIQRSSAATDHAQNMDNDGEKLTIRNGLSAYWLMTDVEGDKAPYVNRAGAVEIDGIDVTSKNIGVRPCIWVSETKIVDIKLSPIDKIVNAINEQIEHFANFMNLFFGKGK